MDQLPEALQALAAYHQFILWKTAERRGKLVKLPVDYRTAAVTDAHNVEAHTDVQTAINAAKAFGDDYGVGFSFTKNDPFFFVDIDKCQVGDGWSDTANAVLTYFPGCAVEVSQSGKGLHIFGTGVAPEHACKNIQHGLEFYTEGRFVALTGTRTLGDANVSSEYLQSFINNFMPPKVTTNNKEWRDGPIDEWNGIDDDDKLIKKACKSKSAAAAFGQRASFNDLWTRNVEVLSDVFPPDESNSGDYDESSADMALMQHLAFWTGNDHERILRLMKQSGLERDKWTVHKDYLRMSITNAVSMQVKVHSIEPKREPIKEASTPMGTEQRLTVSAGFQYMDATLQAEHFAGCVYVQDIHKIFTPKGSFLKAEQFNATYGGYVFSIDDGTSKKETKKAWEAFTESQVNRYKKAETTCFRPDKPPGEFIKNDDGLEALNIYVPIVTGRSVGDATPFVNHLAKLLPDEHDRAILLAYMAACVQHKGVKFQWAPLIQGMEGNGKTLLTRCVAYAVGKKFTHWPPAEQITEKYNEWLYGTIFIGVEDVYIADHKQNVIEVLKPLITNTDQAIRAMGVAQAMHDICCNFMFNSNHKDAIRKTNRDRRFCVFYTAQQDDGDLERDGMSGDYFPKLYDWLKHENGYAIVNEYLSTYVIPRELNPATGCHRAPITSSTVEAIDASLGSVEQELLEAIETGQPGFNGGWVSSIAFANLLDELNLKRSISLSKRKQILNDMGYYYHPNLKQGRVNNSIAIDQGKPRLYIKKDHLSCNLTNCGDITKAYIDAQGGPLAADQRAQKVFK